MKKTKHILLALTSAVMALVVVFAVGCDCKKKPEPGTENVAKTLQSIELDTSNAKTVFIANQDSYSSDGLIIKATYLKKGTTETVVENLTPASKGVTVDSSAFKKDVSGTYEITIFYSYENVFKDASYDVTVTEARAGLDVRLKSGQSNEVTATAGGTDISAVAGWIEVRKPNVLGAIDENSAPLAASEYTVSVYKNSEKIEDLTSVSSGIYQIWASVEYPQLTGYKLEGFVMIEVVDTLVGIEFVSGTTQQTVGADTITATWKFTATFVTGETKELSKADVNIQGVNTLAATDNGVATVSYTYRGETKSTTVNYTIINPTGEVNYTLTYASDGSSKMVTTWDGLQGGAGQITFGGSANSYKQSEKTTASGERFVNLVEIKSNKTITLTFGEMVKAGSINITIYVSHNNTTETRTAKIVKSGDASVTGSIDIAPPSAGAKPPYIVTFGLSGQSAGTYTIDATNTINMYAIEISYTVDYGDGI